MSKLRGEQALTGHKALIREEALRQGFLHCGFARAEPPEEIRGFYSGYLEKNRQLSLSYLQSNFEKRMDPSLVLPGVKSIISLTLGYSAQPPAPEKDSFVIAKYARGADYHEIMKKKMDRFISWLKAEFGRARIKRFVDSGAVPEKFWAMRSGAGWQGKNTLIIHKEAGSFFFIGILLTDLELEADSPATDHCGHCTECIKACPTGALNTPYQLDMSRCISYHTIENKNAIPEDIIRHLGNRIYGCDLCQDVCPYNRAPKPTIIPEFLPSPDLMNMGKTEWLNLSEKQFDRLFGHSPVKRIGYDRLMRNIKAAAHE